VALKFNTNLSFAEKILLLTAKSQIEVWPLFVEGEKILILMPSYHFSLQEKGGVSNGD